MRLEHPVFKDDDAVHMVVDIITERGYDITAQKLMRFVPG